jgi:hypothetical protein
MKIKILYVLEIISFFIPFVIFKQQDARSMILIGFIFTIPFNIFLIKNHKDIAKFFKIINYFILIFSILSLLVAIIAYNATQSFNIL